MTETGTDYKHEHGKLRKEFAEMANRAASEIDALRAEIGRVAPRAEAFDALQQVLNLMPQPSRGMGEDLAWALRHRAKQLQGE